MKIAPALVSTLAVVLALGGCASSAGGGSTPPGEPGPMTGGLTPAPDNHCLLDGAGPVGLPNAVGDFAFDDGTPAGAPPTLAGGDPSGDWVVQGFTLYLPAIATDLVNVAESSIGGTAWLSIGADGQFEMAMDIDISIIIGAGDSATSFMDGVVSAGAIGTYSTAGSDVTIADDCFYTEGLDASGAPGGAEIDRTIAFERTGATGRFLVTLDSDLGALKLLVDVSQG